MRLSGNKKTINQFIALTGVLIFIGLISLSSASGPAAYERFGDSFYMIKHQIFFGLIPGIIGFIAFSRIQYHVWRKYAFQLLLFSVFLLFLVFIPGFRAEFGTSRSWATFLGLFSFQPAEIVKLTFLFYLAAWLEGRGERNVRTLGSGLLPFLSSLGLIMLLIFLQPDVGTMTIIAAMAFSVYFVAGASINHIAAIGAAGLAFLFLAIKTSSYRTARFVTFLHPELDPQGIGYHINQALLAIGSGGVFGLGYGHSLQKFAYLPEVFGDSIFAIMAEEYGFVIISAIVALYTAWIFCGVRIAKEASDKFGTYVVFGIVSWISIQTIVNICSILGLLPMTGVPLPFVSYGGSALAIAMSGIGVIYNIATTGNTAKLVSSRSMLRGKASRMR
ncbi:MAG: Stage V sporulation protein E [uncultured bacterium]|nr:MAG: Stage V sporulation protein E [uncultured bacterium]HBD05019.1 stage V sporulation protein E [Candidatus Uhrbacteria bacterium]